MFFQLRYLVYPAHSLCEISLLPNGPVAVDPSDGYKLSIIPFSGLRFYSAGRRGCPAPREEVLAFRSEMPLSFENGALRCMVRFPQEDRWILKLYRADAVLETYEIYTLEPDLFALAPFKGDDHMHSFFSDGKDSPEYMVAAGCRRGYDFCTLTDHRQYEPSLRARDSMASLGIDFIALPGEEIHAPDNNVHIISLGASRSVNDWYRNEPDDYNAVVAAQIAQLDGPLSEHDRVAVASSQAIFDKIHEYGGLAVLCHPSWIQYQTLQQSEDVTDYLCDHRRFDALELIAGGAFEEGTQMQISYYHDLPQMPILGNSDAHQQFGGRLEPGKYTVAFAKELRMEDIREALRSGLCVAGDENKFYGEYRLIKYAYFLKANVFPEHDRRTAQLGAKLLRYASAGADAAGKYAGEARACASPSAYFFDVRYDGTSL